MTIRLRPGALQDLEAIVALERASPEAPHWASAVYEAMLGPHHPEAVERRLLVAQAPRGLAGFAVASCHADGCGELESVVVNANSRRAGIGRALCAAALDWCRSRGANSVELEVRAGSLGAIALYRQLGFIEVGRRRGYYWDPEEDALLMRAPLK
jgi:ribosomal-protein-alanine N-acetyltransferase